MNEKHITFENLKTVISPVKHLINTKTAPSNWIENDPDAIGYIKNRPFYTKDDGTVISIPKKYIPGVLGVSTTDGVSFTDKDSGKSFASSGGKFNNSAGTININITNSCASSGGYIQAQNRDCTNSQAGSKGTVLSSSYAQANGLGTVANTNYANAIGTYNIYFPFTLFTLEEAFTRHELYNETYYYISEQPVYDETSGLFYLNETPHKIVSTNDTNLSTAYTVDNLKVGDFIIDYTGYNRNNSFSTSYYKIKAIYTHSSGKIDSCVCTKYYSSYDLVKSDEYKDSKYAFIIGNGTSDTERSNAHALDWEGNAWYAGDVYVGSTSGTNKDDGSKKLATEEYVDTKIDKFKNTPFIEGSGTTDSTAKTSTWVGSSDEITEYYDGLAIRYKIGVAGQSTVTLDINGLGAKVVYRFNTTKLTTQFPVGSIINLIYHTDLNDGCWITNDYDANTNTQQRVYNSNSKNIEYPITARYNTTTGETYYAEYGRYSTGVTLNPSKNTITATTFNGDLNGTATKALQDSHGNVIVDAYATKNYIQQEITSKTLTLTGIDTEGISHTWTIYGVAQ